MAKLTALAVAGGMLVWAGSAAAATIRFSAPEQFTTGLGSWFVAAGDLNGDRRPDVAVANAGALGPGGVSLLVDTTAKGASRASFHRCPSLTTNGASQQAVAVADLNGDGKRDLVVGNFLTDGNLPLGPGIQVFVNATAAGAACPTFAAPIDIPAGVGPEVVTVADFNGDGRPDLAFSDYGIPDTGTSDVSVVLNQGMRNGRLSFSPRFVLKAGSQPIGVSPADVNGDGRPDLLVGNNFSANVSVLINRTPRGASTPAFSPAVDFAAGSVPLGPETLTTGDLNADGRPDVLTPNFTSSSGMSVLVNTTGRGAAAASFATAVNYDPGLGPQHIQLADFDGDGKPDIAVALQGTVSAGNQAVLSPSGAISALSPLGSLPFIGNATAGAAPGVIIYANHTPKRATGPVLGSPQYFPAANGSDAIAIADFNGDGKPDLAVANNLTTGPAGLSVLINQTPWPPATTGKRRQHPRSARHHPPGRHHRSHHARERSR